MVVVDAGGGELVVLDDDGAIVEAGPIEPRGSYRPTAHKRPARADVAKTRTTSWMPLILGLLGGIIGGRIARALVRTLRRRPKQ